MRHDPELDELFTDPDEKRVAQLLRDSRPVPPPLDPFFQNALRMKLLAEARRSLSQPARPSWFAYRRLQGVVALAASLAIVVLAGVYLAERRAQPAAIQVVSSLEKNNAATAEPIRIDFRGPVNQNAVAQTVEIQPAAQYTTRWEGQTLIITPLHPLAPNTGYQLKVEPSAGQPGPAPSPPAVVRIVTAPSPPPPVRPLSFQAENLTFLPENRIADPGTVGTSVWTPDGQGLVVTRIGTEPIKPGTTGSPGTTSQTSVVTPDLWLMTPQGTFLRRLAQAASAPAVAPIGSAIAYWRTETSGEVSLQVSALEDDGRRASKISKLGSVPDRPPVWLGTDRLAYVDNGLLHIVDIRGTVIASPKLTVTGSMSASLDGKTLAIETSHGPILYDVATQATSPLPTGAGKFSWAPTGDLAFVVSQPAGPQLWILARDKREPVLRLTGAAAEAWSDIGWAPDGSSLLVASRPTPESGSVSHAFLINVEGKDGRVAFGRNQNDEYAAPRWSPQGATVVFTRHDETGRAALWSTEVRPGKLSAADRAQLDAQDAVDKFMRARLEGKLSDAQSQLSPEALAKYADRLSVGKQDTSLTRYYPVSVQLLVPDKFLIVVRIVQADAKSKQETAFFEERLTVARHDQGFRIDGVEIGKTIRLGQGPAVVSVDLRSSGASGADANRRQLRVQFDADLDPSTVTRDNIYVQDADGNRIKSSISFDQVRHLATLTLPRVEPGKYQLVVSTAVADFKGRTLEEDYEYPLVVTEP